MFRINKKGKFLMSEKTELGVSYTWTDDLNKATLFSSIYEAERLLHKIGFSGLSFLKIEEV